VAKSITEQLRGGDRRSIGASNRVAGLALKQPRIFDQLVRALWDPDPIVRMRAADAAEKASARDANLLVPHKAELLGLLTEATQPELRWHLAQIAPRLKLTAAERKRAFSALQLYLSDRSSIVRTLTLQALTDVAQQDTSLLPSILDLIRQTAKTGTPAMRARSRKLLRRFEKF